MALEQAAAPEVTRINQSDIWNLESINEMKSNGERSIWYNVITGDTFKNDEKKVYTQKYLKTSRIMFFLLMVFKRQVRFRNINTAAQTKDRGRTPVSQESRWVDALLWDYIRQLYTSAHCRTPLKQRIVAMKEENRAEWRHATKSERDLISFWG